MGHRVLTVSARDADEGENARVSYFMADTASHDTQQIFTVQQDSGAVLVRQGLSKRGGMTYEFEVVARDNGVPQSTSVCQVSIQVNKN